MKTECVDFGGLKKLRIAIPDDVRGISAIKEITINRFGVPIRALVVFFDDCERLIERHVEIFPEPKDEVLL